MLETLSPIILIALAAWFLRPRSPKSASDLARSPNVYEGKV